VRATSPSVQVKAAKRLADITNFAEKEGKQSDG
jgi:hypothetical protein